MQETTRIGRTLLLGMGLGGLGGSLLMLVLAARARLGWVNCSELDDAECSLLKSTMRELAREQIFIAAALAALAAAVFLWLRSLQKKEASA